MKSLLRNIIAWNVSRLMRTDAILDLNAAIHSMIGEDAIMREYRILARA